MIHMSISNFILIDNHEFTLERDLTSVTGETGAGKSIVFQAIRFLSGKRFKTSVIKKNMPFTEISASFSLKDFPQLSKFVVQLDLEVEDDEFFIRRKLNDKGVSSAFINGVKVSIGQLKEIGESIFVIVGQDDAHLLSDANYQRDIIDSFGELSKFLLTTKIAFNEVKRINGELKEAEKQQEKISAEKLLMEYQLIELDRLSPQEDEYPALEQEYRQLSNATELSEAYSKVNDVISGGKGAVNKIKEALVALVKFDNINECSELSKILEEAKINLDDLGQEANSLSFKISFDQEQYIYLGEKINSYFMISKKLGCEPNFLHEKYIDLKAEYNRLSSIDIQSIKLKLDKAKLSYVEAANILTDKRLKVAKKITLEMDSILQKLKIRKGAFSVNVTTDNSFTVKGQDTICFMLQSNADSIIAPLVESASGGERSRITLALNSLMSDKDNSMRVHLFDEIDTGVSGETASYIGDLLIKMSESFPVVCITHIPHVAGMARHQLHVEKIDSKDSTLTTLKKVAGEDRDRIIATLLFGSQFSKEQLKQAKKLVLN